MMIDAIIDSEKRIQKIKELEDKVTGIKSTNPQYHKQIAEWFEELKYHKSLLENTKTTNPMYEIGYNKASEDVVDKFADILSNIPNICGRQCPVKCNWGTEESCKDMCKKWLAEKLKVGVE